MQVFDQLKKVLELTGITNTAGRNTHSSNAGGYNQSQVVLENLGGFYFYRHNDEFPNTGFESRGDLARIEVHFSFRLMPK